MARRVLCEPAVFATRAGPCFREDFARLAFCYPSVPFCILVTALARFSAARCPPPGAALLTLAAA
eukprot:3935534-Pyramimonas_sp.AAC.1